MLAEDLLITSAQPNYLLLTPFPWLAFFNVNTQEKTTLQTPLVLSLKLDKRRR